MEDDKKKKKKGVFDKLKELFFPSPDKLEIEESTINIGEAVDREGKPKKKLRKRK